MGETDGEREGELERRRVGEVHSECTKLLKAQTVHPLIHDGLERNTTKRLHLLLFSSVLFGL